MLRKVFLKILEACCLLMLITYAHADEINDVDEKLLLSLLVRSKTSNGQDLLEGDIIQDTLSTYEHNLMKGLPHRGALWSDRIIPYAFHETVNKSTEDVILSAMAEWEKKTCLKFIPRTNQRNFLRFRTDSEGCFTFVGKKSMEGQDVNLGPGCQHVQIAMHEIGHSLGFNHEHSRRDRSSVLKILWQNIKKGMTSQFRPGNDDPRGVPYDVTSIMHYNPMSFSSNMFEKNTMVALDPRLQTLIGVNKGITFRDAKLANILYSCDSGCPNKKTLKCQNEGYLSVYRGDAQPCACVCPPNTRGQRCETIIGDYYGPVPCGGDIFEEGAIETPGYPKRTPNDSCIWQIQAPAGKRVEVTFEDFSFRARMEKPRHPFNGHCVYEHVEIRTSSMDEGTFYCSEDIKKNTKMVSSSNRFLILIKADTKAQGRGLKASVKFI